MTLILGYLEKAIKEVGTSPSLKIVRQNMHKVIRDMGNFLTLEKLARDQLFYDHELASDFSGIVNNQILLHKEAAGRENLSIKENESASKSLIGSKPGRRLAECFGYPILCRYRPRTAGAELALGEGERQTACFLDS